MGVVSALFRREVSLAWGGGGGPLLACGFMVCLTAMLPLAAGGDPQVLAPTASGMAWMALAVASLLSLERMFERDFEDGSLDILAMGPLPLEAVVAIKAVAQWLATGLPLAVMAPLSALVLGQPAELIVLTGVSALLGGLGFAFTGYKKVNPVGIVQHFPGKCDSFLSRQRMTGNSTNPFIFK